MIKIGHVKLCCRTWVFIRLFQFLAEDLAKANTFGDDHIFRLTDVKVIFFQLFEAQVNFEPPVSNEVN